MGDTEEELAKAWTDLATGHPPAVAAAAPIPPCPSDSAHRWVRNSDELGTGTITTADKHFACARAGCGARKVEHWNGDRWESRIYPAGFAVLSKPETKAAEPTVTDYDRGCSAADNSRARVPPPRVDAGEWLRGFDDQTRRNQKPWGRSPDPTDIAPIEEAG